MFSIRAVLICSTISISCSNHTVFTPVGSDRSFINELAFSRSIVAFSSLVPFRNSCRAIPVVNWVKTTL